MQVKILFYGAFRRFGSSVILETQEKVVISDLRRMLIQNIGKDNEALVYDSVFANDTDILVESTLITSPCTLSILPPVCGG